MGLDVSLYGQKSPGDFVNLRGRVSELYKGSNISLGELRGDAYDIEYKKGYGKTFRNLYCEAVGYEIDEIDAYATGFHVHSVHSCINKINGVLKWLDEALVYAYGNKDDSEVDRIMRLKEWFGEWLKYDNIIVEFCE